MQLIALMLLLLFSLATSALLAERFALPRKTAVAAISILTLWLCLLILPLQGLALLGLAGVPISFGINRLVVYYGLIFVLVASLGGWRLRGGAEYLWMLCAELKQIRFLPRHIQAGLCITTGVYAVLAAKMLFTYPNTWDAVAYHYPLALRWLQEGTLRISAATNWRAAMPGNVELLDLLILSSGYDRFLAAVQWPGLLILLLSCGRLARRISDSAAPVWPVLTAVAMIPIVVNQAFSGYVDLFCAACLFGSLALLLAYRDQLTNRSLPANPWILFVAGLASGLAVGAKPVYWLYVGILTLVAACLLFSATAQRSRGGWSALAIFVAAAAVPSLFWFMRAALATGNPVYPLAVDLGWWKLAGIDPSNITGPASYRVYARHWAEVFIYPWMEWKSSTDALGTAYTTGDGLGAVYATFVAPGVLFAMYLAWKQRPALRVWIALLVLTGVSWWFLLHAESRFGLPVLLLCAVIAAPFWGVLERGASRLYGTLYILAFAVTACVLVLEPLYAISQTIRYGQWSRAAFYGYPPVIDTLASGSRVLNLGHETRNFALAGTGLTNCVIPRWERPRILTPEFLRSSEVDYVVQRWVDGSKEPDAMSQVPVEERDLYFSAPIPNAPGRTGPQAEWRIWDTRRFRTPSR